MPFWIKVDRRAAAQPVLAAHQPALRLRDPAPLPEHRERRLLPRARALQRQPRPAGVPGRGEGRLARPAGSTTARRADMLRLPLRATAGLTNWFYGFTRPAVRTARHHRALPPARVHRAEPARPAVRRRAADPADGLDQLHAVARLRAHVPARRHRARRHGADHAQPGAARGARRPRRTGLRRRARAVPAGAGQRRRIRQARNPAAPRRLGRAMQARCARAGDRRRRCSRCPRRGAAGCRSGA